MISKSKDIVVYGCGHYGKIVAKFLIKNNYNLSFFIDSMDSSNEYLGIPIFHPDKLDTSLENFDVIIAIINSSYNSSIELVINNLRLSGAKNIIFMDVFLAAYPSCLLFECDVENIHEKIDYICDHLVDEESKKIYRSVFKCYLNGRVNENPYISETDQYTPYDLPRYPDSLDFIDCGSYVGDTILHLENNKYKFDSIVAFEPELTNFSKMSQLLRNKTKNGIAVPCGVSNTTGIVNFESGKHSGGGCIVDNGNQIIMTVALDDFLPTYSPNLIKMDVEGSELKALQGCLKMLKRSRPYLAIAIYHFINDMWEIPLFLIGLDVSYDFYVRCHGKHLTETILYCYPK